MGFSSALVQLLKIRLALIQTSCRRGYCWTNTACGKAHQISLGILFNPGSFSLIEGREGEGRRGGKLEMPGNQSIPSAYNLMCAARIRLCPFIVI